MDWDGIEEDSWEVKEAVISALLAELEFEFEFELGFNDTGNA